jgi:YfiH family protein
MTLPPIPDSFRWTNESWGPALRCVPLGAVAPHLFTTRQLELSAGNDWWPLADALGVRRIVTLTQIHGRSVVVVRHGVSTPRGRPEADVIVSNDPEVAIAVRAADCVPLLLADSKTGAVAAVHAGWRGTAASAAIAAVEALAREFNTRPEDLVAAVGPSIGPCCYEVGSELVDAFAAAGHARHLIDRWFATPPPPRGSREPSPLRLDVAAANRDQLMLAGVAGENIHMSGLCTAMHLEVLTSFRAEKENAGRLAGVIRARAG